jgi:hypothetical protein
MVPNLFNSGMGNHPADTELALRAHRALRASLFPLMMMFFSLTVDQAFDAAFEMWFPKIQQICYTQVCESY